MASVANLISVLLAVVATSRSANAESHYAYADYKATCQNNYYQCQPATLQARLCQTGWTGCKCDTPVCDSPKCTGDKVCIAPNKCGCLKSGTGGSTNCPYAQCTSEPKRDCYPGTCSDNLVNCTCPTQLGFTGENCLNIALTPEIKTCKVGVYNNNSALVKQVDCASTGFNPPVTWINVLAVGDVRAEWQANYIHDIALPTATYVTYMKVAPVAIGVTNSSFDLTLIETLETKSEKCLEAFESWTPRTTANCDRIINWRGTGLPWPQHGQSFRVTIRAQLGGQKQVKEPEGAIIQQFIGTPSTRSAVFKFDLQPPVHCLSNSSNECPFFAIYLDQDIRTNSKIEARFYNWTDDGSGIDRFQVDIFRLQESGSGLENTGSPLSGSSQNVSPEQNYYVFFLRDAGIYSLELTVHDKAGNTARARKLFIYNADSQLRIDPLLPVRLLEANPSTNYTWLTDFANSRDGGYIPLTVSWQGHFSSSAEFAKSGTWNKAAKAWPAGTGIDDRYGTKYGRRSIEPISALQNGIAFYRLAFVLDPDHGGSGLSPTNWIQLNATDSSYKLPINNSLTDGSAIVVWLQCTDAAFSSLTERLTIGVDRSPPEIKQQTFKKRTGYAETNSSLEVYVADLESGLAEFTYRIYASEVPLILRKAAPQMRVRGNRTKRAVNQPCTASDPSCYCTPDGRCFNYVQAIEINNCDIDRFAGQYFVIRYTVTNSAGLISPEQTIEAGYLSGDDIPCRKFCGNGGLCPGQIAGIVIGTIFGFILLLLLIFVLIMLIRIYYFKKPVPRRFTNIHQTVRNRLGRNLEDENAAYESSGALSGLAKKISVKFHRETLYKGKGADDDYIYTGSEGLRNNSIHIPRKNLQMEQTISNEGRFAVIKKAYLQDGNEQKSVAVKALRSGFSAADAKLMEEKIQFLSALPRHANIVNFLGTCEEENNGGPIMVLEHCEIPLKDWLKDQKKVTSEVLENMLTFTLNIARGVEHLHANDVIHRRLAVRNVLLTQQFGGWVAKLIGFGPIRDNSADKTKKAAVPVKWLAPETLSTINDIDPTYNEKTDAWSFGITVWEIYSLGETPYPTKSSNEAKKLIIKGLKSTKPDECPPELFETAIQPCWETNPSHRPTMTHVCSSIESFRDGTQLGGGGGGQGYYGTDDDDYRNSGANGGNQQGDGELYDDGR